MDDLEAPPLQAVFGLGLEAHTLVGSAMCQVTYHNKHPAVNEMVKIALPIALHERHHILFTFYHVKVSVCCVVLCCVCE